MRVLHYFVAWLPANASVSRFAMLQNILEHGRSLPEQLLLCSCWGAFEFHAQTAQYEGKDANKGCTDIMEQVKQGGGQDLICDCLETAMQVCPACFT